MIVEIRGDSVTLTGYVNAVERESRILPSSMSPKANKSFVERVRSGTFTKALQRGKPVEWRFNHARTLGSTESGSITLVEDAIGLKAVATTSDPEIVQHAKAKELRGWSFGFVTLADEWSEDETRGIQTRTLDDIDLREVSVLTSCPAYIATTVELRGDDTTIREERDNADEAEEIREIEPESPPEPNVPDYGAYERDIEICRLSIGAK